jgi:hypothetical protein
MNFTPNIKYHQFNSDARNLNIFRAIDLNIFFININHLANKIPRIEFVLSNLNVKFGILVFCETWLREDQVQFINFHSFQSYHRVRRNQLGGGLAIYTHDSLVTEEIRDDTIDGLNQDGHEFLLVKVTSADSIICAVYRKPGSNIQSFFKKLDKILSMHDNVIVMGDTNINTFVSNHITLSFTNTLESNGYCLANSHNSNMYTRKSQHGTITCIDHLAFNKSFSVNKDIKFAVGDNDLSDHRFLITSFSLNSPIAVSTKKPIFKIDYNKIKSHLASFRNDNFDNFHEKLQSKVTNFSNISYPTNKDDSQGKWFTDDLRNRLKIRDKFYKLHRKHPNNSLYESQFKFHRNRLQWEIKKAKNNFQSKSVLENASNPFKFWRCVSLILHNTNKSNNSDTLPPLKDGRNLAVNDKDKANVLNKYFVSVGKSIIQQNTQPRPSRLCNNPNISSLLSDFSPTTPEELTRVIKSLKNRSSAGYDRIKPIFIKNNVSFFAQFLSDKINEAFDSGQFPDPLKIAKVVPIFKGGSKNDTSNYRPISIVSIFAKIFEIIIASRLQDHLIINNLIHANQFGFVKKSSTTSAATNLVNEIVKRTNGKLKTSCLFLDLRKAFDCLNFDILLELLHFNGIRNKALHLFKSYLNNRKQFVSINNSKSDTMIVECGVPQGSVLGPLLFLIYINQIFGIELNAFIQLYADDTALVYGEKDLKTLKCKMTEDLNKLVPWLKSLNLAINYEKTKYILFNKNSSNHRDRFDRIQIGSDTILRTNSYSYLGLIIDEKLNWSAHISSLCSKISKYTFVFAKLRHIMCFTLLKRLYYALVHSNIVYLLPIWGNAPQTYLNCLQTLQNKIVKIIKFLPFDSPTDSLYSTDFLSIKQQFKYESILLIYRMSHGLLKSGFQFVTNFAVTGRITRSSTNLRLPHFLTASAQNTIFYKGLDLYNALPPQLKSSLIADFKRGLKLYILA